MSRPVILGNSQLTVGLNESGLVHDFYYPYVGLDNLSTARKDPHRIGIWIDNQFSWIESGDWQIEVDFESTALVGRVTMKNERLNIGISTEDFVDHEFNVLCRRLSVKNLSSESREVRLFLHQVFEISRGGRGDTALFIPEEHYLLDYKGRCSLLIYAQTETGRVFDQFAVGNYGIEGKEGTWRDAEDGTLSGSPVEHGGVDSVLGLTFQLDSTATTTVDYWIIAADSQYNAEKIHHRILEQSLSGRLNQTRQFWQEWLDIAKSSLVGIDEKYQDITKKSLMVIKAHTDKRGGIIASCDSSIYNFGRDYYSYVWPRDGAYAIWPLIRMGYQEEARRFFEFCRDILTEDGYLMHKYQPDRAIGSTWHPLLHGRHAELAIQEDETALVLYMLGEYLSHTEDEDFVRSVYTTFIQPAANFMADFIDEHTSLPHASYDLWEEKFLTTTYTSSVVYQALLVAGDLAEKFEYPDDAVDWREAAETIQQHFESFFDQDRQSYIKGFLASGSEPVQLDKTIDVSSFFGPMMFGGGNAKSLQSTVKAIEQTLLDSSPAGGSPRYEHDSYFVSDSTYMGNPWPVTTLWLAQYYIRSHQVDKGRQYVDWTINKCLHSGVLPEQVNPTTGEAISVTPLVWSHAELINTVLDLKHHS